MSVTGEPRDSAVLARGAGILLVGRTLGRGVGFVAQLILGRLLGPAAFGLYAIGWNLFLIAGQLASLGLEHGVVRYAAPRDQGAGVARAVATRSLRATLLASSFAAVVLAFAAGPLAEGVFGKPAARPVILAFSAGLLVLPALRVAAAATRASQRMHWSVVAEDMVQPGLHLVLILVLVLGIGGVVPAVWAMVGSYIGGLAVALVFVRRALPPQAVEQTAPVGGATTAELVRFSIPAATAGMLSVMAMWIDRLFVGYFLTEAATGLYQAASHVSIGFTILLASFNAIFGPMSADLWHRNETDRLNALFKVGTKWGLYLGLPAFIVVLAVPEAAIVTLLDARYADAATPLVILCAAQTANLATGAVGFLMVMTGRQNRWLGLSAVALGMNVVLNVVLIPRFELVGAATATAISVAFLFGGGLAAVRGGLGLWPYDRRYAKGGVATAAAALATFGVARYGPEAPAALLAAAIVVSLASFFGVLLALGLDDEDRDLARRLRRRLG